MGGYCFVGDVAGGQEGEEFGGGADDWVSGTLVEEVRWWEEEVGSSRAVQSMPASKALVKTARPHPPVAPKKATTGFVDEEGVLGIIAIFCWCW